VAPVLRWTNCRCSFAACSTGDAASLNDGFSFNLPFIQCNAGVALLGVPLVTGAVLTFLFVMSHNFEGSDRSPAAAAGRQEVDFYRLQVL
jgi:hypothetical protein